MNQYAISDAIAGAYRRKAIITEVVAQVRALHTSLVNDPLNNTYTSLKANCPELANYRAVNFDSLIDEVTRDLRSVANNFEDLAKKIGVSRETSCDMMREHNAILSLYTTLPKKFSPEPASGCCIL